MPKYLKPQNCYETLPAGEVRIVRVNKAYREGDQNAPAWLLQTPDGRDVGVYREVLFTSVPQAVCECVDGVNKAWIETDGELYVR